MIHMTSGFRDFFTLLHLSGHNEADFYSPDNILRIVVRQRGLNNIPETAIGVQRCVRHFVDLLSLLLVLLIRQVHCAIRGIWR